MFDVHMFCAMLSVGIKDDLNLNDVVVSQEVFIPFLYYSIAGSHWLIFYINLGTL